MNIFEKTADDHLQWMENYTVNKDNERELIQACCDAGIYHLLELYVRQVRRQERAKCQKEIDRWKKLCIQLREKCNTFPDVLIDERAKTRQEIMHLYCPQGCGGLDDYIEQTPRKILNGSWWHHYKLNPNAQAKYCDAGPIRAVMEQEGSGGE